MRVLNELRPAGEGFAGIPQETRLIHSALLDDDRLDVTGFLNAHNHVIRVPRRMGGTGSDEVFYKSRWVLALEGPQPRLGLTGKLLDRLEDPLVRANELLWLKAMQVRGTALQLYRLDMDWFNDYLWRTYFSKSLPASDLAKISSANYATIPPPWSLLNTVGRIPPLAGRYVGIDTQEFDVAITQTPFPGGFSPRTQHVIRYHDAIPIFYPHTIHSALAHQFSAFFPLKFNLECGARLICNSENSRREFAKLFPRHEERAEVIPCMLSPAYDPRPADAPSEPPEIQPDISEIIRTNLEQTTTPRIENFLETELFFKSALGDGIFPYLLMVSTIEPRKNHGRLVAAWAALREKGYPNLKLIIVGRPGWRVGSFIEQLKTFQERGLLFNLSGVPAPSLKRLYRNAAAVVCPSIAEGFDLAGIEAMLSGGIVAASDIPVHREIYGEGCTYFNPYSTGEAVVAIEQLVNPANVENVNEIRRRGYRQAQKYRMDQIAPQWHNYFERLRAERD